MLKLRKRYLFLLALEAVHSPACWALLPTAARNDRFMKTAFAVTLPLCTAMAPRFVEAGEAIRAAGAATSDVAERLPNWYSSKQGLTEENPTVFGSAGLGLEQAGDRLVAGDDCVADITFAACALEPIELDADLHDAADAFLEQTILTRRRTRSTPRRWRSTNTPSC